MRPWWVCVFVVGCSSGATGASSAHPGADAARPPAQDARSASPSDADGAPATDGATDAADAAADATVGHAMDAASDSGTVAPACTVANETTTCPSKVCVGGVCAAPTPHDGVKNDSETDVDCGGSSSPTSDGAPPCADGLACTVASDCADEVCANGVCQPPSPTDGVRNDSETDVDCGGALTASGAPNPASDGAPACATGQTCATGHDCVEGVCAASVGATGSGDAGVPGDAGAHALVCQPPGPTDGVMNGGETDVDCGGGTTLGSDGAPACASGLHCLVASDCASDVCTGAVAATGSSPAVAGICSAPSCSDGVKNGGETDVDCGGGTCPACALGKSCTVSGDCVTSACNYASLCVSAPSCVGHNGGDTCGPGEVGDPAAVHEDCCLTVVVPRPAASGGPFALDKYLITAGRMRAFLEAVNYDVYDYIQQNTPSWWGGTGTSTWNAMLPTSHDDFITKTSSGGSGCVVGTAAGDVGAPAYWETAADLAAVVGGAPRAYTEDEMDTKVMNCFAAPLFHALCAYDGGRLPSLVEWTAARTTWNAAGTATVMQYPWPNDGANYQTKADRESHAVYDTIGDSNYYWPSLPTGNDYGAYLGAPGRFPLGAGPYGHQDLMGSVENMGSQPNSAGATTVKGDGWFQFSFQEAEQSEHPYGQEETSFGSGAYRTHWAVGARCRKLP